MSASDSGRRAENAVVEFLVRAGWPFAERRRLQGTKDRGDIAAIPGVVVQVKGGNGGATGRVRLGEWLDDTEEQIENAGADTGVLIVKRPRKGRAEDWYAVMPAHRWAKLMKEAGY